MSKLSDIFSAFSGSVSSTSGSADDRIDRLEKKMEEMAKEHTRIKKLLVKNSLDLTNLETIVKATVVSHSDLSMEVNKIIGELRTYLGDLTDSLTAPTSSGGGFSLQWPKMGDDDDDDNLPN